MRGPRSRARRLALQYLYYAEARGAAALPFGEFVESLGPAGGGNADLEYAEALASGVLARRDELDGLIGAAAENWEIGRISSVERNVLRIGAIELIPDSEVPPISAIDEAITLAKDFGDKASGGFVNGVLDAVRRGLEQEDRK